MKKQIILFLLTLSIVTVISFSIFLLRNNESARINITEPEITGDTTNSSKEQIYKEIRNDITNNNPEIDIGISEIVGDFAIGQYTQAGGGAGFNAIFKKIDGHWKTAMGWQDSVWPCQKLISENIPPHIFALATGGTVDNAYCQLEDVSCFGYCVGSLYKDFYQNNLK